jgi:hypothetical protein
MALWAIRGKQNRGWQRAVVCGSAGHGGVSLVLQVVANAAGAIPGVVRVVARVSGCV